MSLDYLIWCLFVKVNKDNIQTLTEQSFRDVEGKSNKLEIANNKLNKEILELECLVEKLKQEQKKAII